MNPTVIQYYKSVTHTILSFPHPYVRQVQEIKKLSTLLFYTLRVMKKYIIEIYPYLAYYILCKTYILLSSTMLFQYVLMAQGNRVTIIMSLQLKNLTYVIHFTISETNLLSISIVMKIYQNFFTSILSSDYIAIINFFNFEIPHAMECASYSTIVTRIFIVSLVHEDTFQWESSLVLLLVFFHYSWNMY